MPKIIDSFELCGVNLDIYDGPVGIMCSGGADSSLLLYHLMKHKKDDIIHVYSTGNNQRNRRNVHIATQVVEQCIQLTGNSNIEHHISYCDIQSFETLFPKMRPQLEIGNIGIVYTGITSNPPVEVTEKFKLEITQTDRNPGEQKELLHYNGSFYTPWYNVNKKKIAEIYQLDNLIDDLFPLTRSCEYDPTSAFFNNIPDPGLDHCGECWWCEEREWAFGRLK